MAVQAGCAGRRSVPSVAGPSVPAPAEVTEAERAACDAYSRKQPTPSYAGPILAGVALLPSSLLLGLMGTYVGYPQGFLLAPEVARKQVERVKQEKRAIRSSALEACLEPAIRAHRLGQDHPDVADALAALADHHAGQADDTGAVALYRQALDIRERALGPDHLQVAMTLEVTAGLLRRMHLEEKAGGLEARAQAIRIASGTESDAVVPGPPPSAPTPRWDPIASPSSSWGAAVTQPL
jgi:hypothetical protein